MLAFSALAWVVAHAVYAPGRITLQRLQGAVVVYLNLAVIFAAAYSLIWELIPDAFANIAVPTVDQKEVGIMLYFSLTTLTTTGYGDIVPVDPFARSLANLESVVGPFFLAITVADLGRGYRRRSASSMLTSRATVMARNNGPITDSRLARLRANGSIGTTSP